MTLPSQLAERLHDEPALGQPRLHVRLARTADEIRAAQRLRYRVFVEEMRARIACAEPGIEAERFDPSCEHLLVLDNDAGTVVADANNVNLFGNHRHYQGRRGDVGV